MRVERGRNRREGEREREREMRIYRKKQRIQKKKARGSIDEVERRGLTEHEHE